LYSEKTCFADRYPETSENAQNKGESAKQKHIFRNVQGKEMEKPIFMRHLGRDTTTGEA
jgi:hypothetical protein